MHPLHDYIVKQLAKKVKDRQVIVWYDPQEEYTLFINELVGEQKTHGSTTSLIVDEIQVHFVEYYGSYFEVRKIVEPLVCGDVPELVVIYVPAKERDRHGSVLMELEKAGECYEPELKRQARNVLRQRYTDGIIDEMLASELITYYDLARASSEDALAERPSILKSIFHGVSGNSDILAEWIARNNRDEEIEKKEATRELVKLVDSQLGLKLSEEAAIAKIRAITVRYVLANEFRADLQCTAPSSLDSVPLPKTKDQEDYIKTFACKLRSAYSNEYTVLADQVERELGLQDANISAAALGSIDTFRFEEKEMLEYCSSLIASHRFEEALSLVGGRENNFWLDSDVGRKAQWEACRRMANLGEIAIQVQIAISSADNNPNWWVNEYTTKEGWYRLDQAQRRLETLVGTLEEEPDEQPLFVVRRLYEDVCQGMAEGFTRAMVKANWTGLSSMGQTRIFPETIDNKPKPIAYFLVDALRFEMGLELAQRLPTVAEVEVRHAFGAIPTITPIGMGALLPGASSSFSVVEQNGKLGVRIEDAFMPDLPARKKFISSRVPGLVDITLNDLLGLGASKLIKRLEGGQVIIIRSQEIDHAGETGSTFQARQVMDTVIDNLARAIKKLSLVGVEYSVVTADHGHLFFATDRDESMRTDSPGGNQIELHRRCWIGHGGQTPIGCVRVAASSLGYDSDLDFVFPTGSGVFKSGGDLAYHHGGLSLQELVIPILSVRLKGRLTTQPFVSLVQATGIPDAITNRIFSVTLQFGGPNLSLFPETMIIRPLLMAEGRQVGAVGMAIDAELDRNTGCVKLPSEKLVTVAFLLSDETVSSLRVVIQDPTTDAELYRSPKNIPVRLGV